MTLTQHLSPRPSPPCSENSTTSSSCTETPPSNPRDPRDTTVSPPPAHQHRPPVPITSDQEPPAIEERWGDFNIDALLLRLCPWLPTDNALHKLPRGISHFLGYRPAQLTQRKSQAPMDIIIWSAAAVGCFMGIAGVTGLTMGMSGKDTGLVGSMGAAAILLFLTPLSPLAQPRNLLLSQLISSLIGLGIGRAIPQHWVGPAVCVALSAIAMLATRTVHPPAGATAVLAYADPRWSFVALVMASTGLLAAVAGGWVNVCGVGGWEGGRWPGVWWWAEERGAKVMTGETTQATPGEKISEEWAEGEEEISIGGRGVQVPVWFELSAEERDVLEGLWDRLKERKRPAPRGS
ncbi:HPP family-domain-containing protein [Pyronema domesticum]|uniref:Similar to Transmembrane protein DDB_G0273707/DDB_G0273361 acc. no. Q556Z9 n=1 Tax=Pyronema omphalodes (strain CBS 100304) TaxID=1076935 RepID=U4L180_PYROM|nr:HPP family-domain-containing protein [Pyronema domesticum]CCX09617.1 Similar to Transmembrane protein DDB_G0273707/DDB_G0273361; acc. no. Q556Z9 [Pyronema omphalodes CBS 100304]